MVEVSYISLDLSFPNNSKMEDNKKNKIKIEDFINTNISKNKKYIIPKVPVNICNKTTIINKNESKTIKISNIPDKINKESIKELFNQFGEIKYINIIYSNRMLEITKGFGFIEFYELKSCIKAVTHKKIKYEHSIIDILHAK